jgi:hypothetical protein
MRSTLALGVLLLCGCPSMGTDMPDLGDQDLAGADLAGADLTGVVQDLSGPVGPDMTQPPDLADPNSMPITWALWDSKQSSKRIACDDMRAQLTKVVVTAEEVANGQIRTTEFACPAGAMFGDGTIKLSSSMGTFKLIGTTVGMAMGTSDPIMAMPTDSVEINIYLF